MATGKLEVDLILNTAKAQAAAQAFMQSVQSGGGMKKKLTDDSAALDNYWKKLEKVDGLAKAITGGKWFYDANKSPVKKMADDSERLSKWLQKAHGLFPGLDKVGKSLLGGAWNYTPGKPAPTPTELQKQLQEWRDKMKGNVPNVSIMGDNDHDAHIKAFARANYEASRSIPTGSGGILTSPNATMSANQRNKKDISAVADAIADQEKERAMAKTLFRSKVQFYKDLTFLFQPLLNPTSLWGNMFAARQTFSAFSTEEGQRRIGGGGAAGALKATAILQGAALAVGLSLMALRKAISFTADEIKKSFQFAHSLYAKSLQSGLNLQFTARRQMTADVLGVDEKQIFRFGQAGMVMAQLADATNKIARSAPDLAYTSAQFKILEYNILADASVLADRLSPALNKFADAMETLLTMIENHAATIANLFKSAAVGALSTVNPLLGSLLNSLTQTIAAAAGNGNSGAFGQPQTFMKQLPAGAFEKMGLVIGGGMADKALEYQRRTAAAVEKIANNITNAKGHATPFYMGRNPFVSGY